MSDISWWSRIKRIFGGPRNEVEDLISTLKDASEREIIEPNTFSMLEGVLDVSEIRAKDVMVPRSQMITLPNDMPLQELVPIVTKSGHSRFPVIGENKDEVIGILLAKDLIGYGFGTAKKPFNIAAMLRPAMFIPEGKRLNVLLQDFRVNNNHMAIVVDEYGRITGLITIEDVLEQIVGEIEDEHDTNTTPSISQQSDGIYTVKAVTSLEEYNDYFESELAEEGVETIGGLVMRTLGHLPKRGETVNIGPFHFTVLRADNRRVYLLSVNTKIQHHEHPPLEE